MPSTTTGAWTSGVLYYYYPGSYFHGVTKPNTTELYIAGSWKWVSLKYSDSVDDTFGVPDSQNSWYLDLSANYPDQRCVDHQSLTSDVRNITEATTAFSNSQR